MPLILKQYIYCFLQNIWYTITKEGGTVKNKKMKMARIEAEMSQADLADEVGVTRQTIGLIESGKFNPSLRLCIDICRVLKKTLNDIFWEEHDEKE